MSFKDWWYGPEPEPQREPETRSVVESDSDDDGLSGVIPNPENRGEAVPVERALSIPAVYRAVQIIETAAMQLSVDAFRGNDDVSADHSFIQRPNFDTPRSAFFAETATCLATYGNAYWLIDRGDSGRIVNLTLIGPNGVDPQLDANGRVVGYLYNGRTLAPNRVKHLKFMRVPGRTKGLSPIDAARVPLSGILDVLNHSSAWFTDSGIARGGFWTSDQNISQEQAKKYRSAITAAVADRKGTPVVGDGLGFQSTNLSPKDALWIDAQQFNTTQIARLFGIPASLMMSGNEGSSQTYSNVSQMWTEFARFTLTRYTREMEEALSDLLPHGTVARFNFSALLRPDDASRWAIHTQAIAAGVHSVNEVRAIENEAPIPGGDHKTPAEIAAAKAQFEPATETPEEEAADE